MSIQGQILEIRVLGCSNLRDTELFTRQDPYVCVEYANSKFRTRTCTDGGRNPTFQEKFQIPLVEGLRELNIVVWNSNTFSRDDFIGSGRVQLYKVLLQGYDDSSWPLQTRHMRPAGEVKLVLHYASATATKQKLSTSSAANPPVPAAPYSPYAFSYPQAGAYPSAGACPSAGAYPTYPAPSPPAYSTSAYPPPPLQQPHLPTAYPPIAYPPQQYGQPYQPPPPQYPPGPYPGSYPPPPY